MRMNLDEAIAHCEERIDCTDCGREHKQLRNWLVMLRKYIERDIPQPVKKISLSGRGVCPACGELMAINVKNFCDNCGQAIKLN